MVSFESDYNNGCHPLVMQHLTETNHESSLSYGFDLWSERAKLKIREACECPDADVFFLVGGTQTNATVIDATLRSYEGVVSVESGHINVHESGAIEATGHKVLTLPDHQGKMDARELEAYLQGFHTDEAAGHMVRPGMVYITQPTELGTIYSAQELVEIHHVCQQYHIPLYVDGARLGYALASNTNDVSLPFLARHCDAFYIGGTKVGALCGEAVVFPHRNADPHFFTIVKQHGALLAKSRLAGVQFDALFTDSLYLRISRNAILWAERVKEIFRLKGYPLLLDSPTNQIFVILSDTEAARLRKKVRFEKWCPKDEKRSVYRFVTSWATTESDIQTLESIVNEKQEE